MYTATINNPNHRSDERRTIQLLNDDGDPTRSKLGPRMEGRAGGAAACRPSSCVPGARVRAHDAASTNGTVQRGHLWAEGRSELHIWRHSRANPPLTDKQTYRGVIPESQRGHLRAQSVLLCMSYHRTTHFPEPNKVCRNNHTDSCGCDLWNRGPVPVEEPEN